MRLFMNVYKMSGYGQSPVPDLKPRVGLHTVPVLVQIILSVLLEVVGVLT